MPRMPDDMAARYGGLLDEYDASIKVLNKSKSDTLEGLRGELKSLGLVGAEISAEIAMLKGAVKVLSMTQVEQQKANNKDEGISDYIAILSLARARAHTREASSRHGAGEASGAVSVADAAPLAEIPAAILPAQSYGVDPERTAGAAVEDETAQDQAETPNDDRSCVSVPGGLANGLQQQATREGESARPLPTTISIPAQVVAADSDGSGATPALVATNSGQPSPDTDRSGHTPHAVASQPAPVDRSKPNPWCMDPDECGVEASWDYFCLKCQAVKKGREAAGAALQ